MLTLPNLATVDFANACTAAGWLTSVGIQKAVPPSEVTIAATSLKCSPSRAASTTAAPDRANAIAISRPIPLLAPVTMATWPFSELFIVDDMLRSRYRLLRWARTGREADAITIDR